MLAAQQPDVPSAPQPDEPCAPASPVACGRIRPAARAVQMLWETAQGGQLTRAGVTSSPTRSTSTVPATWSLPSIVFTTIGAFDAAPLIVLDAKVA